MREADRLYKNNRIMKRIGILLLVLIAFYFWNLISFQAAAKNGSIELSFPVEDTQFSLYKLGSYDPVDGYVLEERFAKYGVDLNETDAATTFELYVRKDQLKPDAKAKTDGNGKVKFTNLEKGAYLLIGDIAYKGNIAYTPFASMISVPQWEKDDVLVYDIKAQAKYGEGKKNQPEKITVLKIWKNDEDADRPGKIVVQLLKDGKLAEEYEDAEVELSKVNNWTYSWEITDKEPEWTVVEKEVPSDYKVNIRNTFTTKGKKVEMTAAVTNTYEKPNNPPSNPPSNKIPQTGQLWWPVGILAAAGLFLILVGLLLKQERK